VLGQSVLLGGVILLAVFHHGGFHPVTVIAGAVLLLSGGGVALAGAVSLGRNLTPFPQPVDQGLLVRHGIYGRIRHPLYTSVIAASLGWALVWQSGSAVVLAGIGPGTSTVMTPWCSQLASNWLEIRSVARSSISATS